MIKTVVKSMFFDRQKVMAAAHRAKMRNLARAGAMIRTTAQRSMRYRKKASAAGAPPSAHKPNALLRKRTFFGYDQGSDSVVVGPERLQSKAKNLVPETLEHGGTVEVPELQYRGLWVRRQATVAARPHMGPALTANRPKLAGLWANSIK